MSPYDQKIQQYEALIKLHQNRVEALLKLPEASDSMPESDFMQYGQELTENLTESRIAFIHFVNDDEKTIELVTWSNRTIQDYCNVVYATHYPVDKAGVWAEALRTRQAVVVNDYETCDKKRGLPEGHASLNRFISVPVIESGKAVMLAGVGNKAGEYDQIDVETVQLLANEIWRLVQRKRTQDTLLKSRFQLEDAQRVAQIGSFEYYPMSKNLSASHEFCSIFKVEPNILNHGFSFKSFCDDRQKRSFVKPLLTLYRTNTIVQYECEITIPEGENKYISVNAEFIRAKNPVYHHILGTVQDVTDRVRYEKELVRKDEIMIAQSRHAAMGEMISMIAHQWRQPISVISMSANNLLADIELDEIDPDSIRDASATIVRHTDYLSKTIDDFRNFFKPNKSKDVFYVREVIEEARGVMGKSLEQSQIELTVHEEENSPVFTYSRELMQVLINLFKNAREALEGHRTDNRKIQVSIFERDGYVVIAVSDNAGGIGEAYLDRIFEPYFTTKGVKSGTGLGLYMTKTIIEKHMDGTIRALNTETGACFEISIPVNG